MTKIMEIIIEIVHTIYACCRMGGEGEFSQSLVIRSKDIARGNLSLLLVRFLTMSSNKRDTEDS